MGRPPSNGVPAFRFTPTEVSEMDAILREHSLSVPQREVLTAIAEKFSKSTERSGKVVVQMKQVWNWFQNRRYALRAKLNRDSTPAKLSVSTMPREEPSPVKHVPQPVPTPSVVNIGKNTMDNAHMEFEAKSARDGAWYDVATFLSHRYFETGDPEVLVRFSGFGAEEDEWVNVRKHIRQRSLPCESSECVAVLPGDLILCFQEGKEQALYFDAHVLDAQRRRHDVRGCRCRFLVRYDHDQSEGLVCPWGVILPWKDVWGSNLFKDSETTQGSKMGPNNELQEIVPLRKVCRRPETDYRLQQLRPVIGPASLELQKNGKDPSMAGSTVSVSDPAEMMPAQHKADENSTILSAEAPHADNVPVTSVSKKLKTENVEMCGAGNVGNSDVDSGNTATSGVSGGCSENVMGEK